MIVKQSFRATCSADANERGETQGAVIVVEDITAIKLADELNQIQRAPARQGAPTLSLAATEILKTAGEHLGCDAGLLCTLEPGLGVLR